MGDALSYLVFGHAAARRFVFERKLRQGAAAIRIVLQHFCGGAKWHLYILIPADRHDRVQVADLHGSGIGLEICFRVVLERLRRGSNGNWFVFCGVGDQHVLITFERDGHAVDVDNFDHAAAN